MRFATSEAPGGLGGMRPTASLGPGGTGPSMNETGKTASTPSGLGRMRSTASPVNDNSLSLREGVDRAPHGESPTLAPRTNYVGRALGSGEAIPPRMTADCRSARRLGIRAGWVSKPLGPNRRTGRVHVALSARTTGRSRTRAGAPHHPSTWRWEWQCTCGGIVPLLRRPLGRAVATTELLAGATCPKCRLPGGRAARHRPNAQARTAILPPVEVRPVSRAIPTLSNLTSHIQRSVPGGRPTRAAAETGPRPLAQPRLTN